MSSARWPHGALAAALIEAHAAHPFATAPQLAIIVGCKPECARGVLRNLNIRMPSAQTVQIDWTKEMKAALIDGTRRRASLNSLATQIGVPRASLLHGALEVIRDLEGACAA